MSPIVITTCTNRKRTPPRPELCGRTLAQGDLNAVATAWVGRLREPQGSVAPLADLYCGRSFREAEAAAQRLKGSLWIVSAGLGLAAADTRAPSYSMTLARESADCVFRAANVSSSAWWRAINEGSPFAVGLRDGGGLILAALSRPYLEMVAADWAAWPSERLARLRLFSVEPPGGLPQPLRRQWMPYDSRLEAVSGRGGTRGDFAQRALRHFAEEIAPRSGAIEEDAAAVRAALAPYEVAAWPVRWRASDEDLVELILREWDVVNGRSGAMLRRLRRDLDIACEQGRFKTLFRKAAAVREGALL